MRSIGWRLPTNTPHRGACQITAEGCWAARGTRRQAPPRAMANPQRSGPRGRPDLDRALERGDGARDEVVRLEAEAEAPGARRRDRHAAVDRREPGPDGRFEAG